MMNLFPSGDPMSLQPFHRHPHISGTRWSRPLFVTALLASLPSLVFGCARDETFDAPLTPEARAKIPFDAMEFVTGTLVDHGAAQVMMVVEPPPPDGASAASTGFDEFRVVRMATVKAALQLDLGVELVVDEDYDHLPIQLVSVASQTAMAKLLEDPRVVSVDRVRLYDASTDVSLPLIGQPTAVAEGKTGQGVSVAVLDTGADFTNPAFGSCSAVNTPLGSCRVVFADDFPLTIDDGARDTGIFHGTNVSGIVAATAPGAQILALDVFDAGTQSTSIAITSAINFVIANKSTFNIAAMNLSLGGGAFTSPCPTDLLATAVASARDAGILSAVATGNNGTTNAISAPACGPAAVSVAAVYDSAFGSISCPTGGFDASATDKITCFSNTSSFTTVAAPGSQITAAGITMSGTSQASPHVAGAIAVLKASFPAESPSELVARLTSTGTSVTRGTLTLPRLNLAAAASGCVFSVTPSRHDVTTTTASTVQVQLSTGPGCAWVATSSAGFMSASPSSGSGSATVTLSLQANTGAVRAATLTVSGGAGTTATARTVQISQGADTVAPTGTVLINSGAATTTVPTVLLAITAEDPSGVPLMCVTQLTTCTVFEPFASSKTITLTATGAREVRVFLRDARGNTSTATNAPKDTIVFDTAGPTGGALTVTPLVSSLKLDWTAAADALAGLGGYQIFANVGSATAPACSGTPVGETTDTVRTFTHTGLPNGVPLSYRICPVDKAGNVGVGFTGSGTARAELTPPTGTIELSSPTPGFTRLAAVAVTLTAADPSGVTGVCVTLASTCTTFETVATTPSFSRQGTFTLTTTPGVKAVNVFFRDALGNVSTTPAATASIVLDTVAPGGGTLTATPGSGQVSLALAGVTDSPAGVSLFRIVRAEGTALLPPTAPATCATGTPSGEFTTSPMVITGLSNRTVYAFRVCAIDKAGNIAAGVTKVVEPRAEFVVPTATVVVNAGAVATNSPTLQVVVNVVENAGLESLCLGFAATGCTTFVPVDPIEVTATTLTRTVTLPTTTAGVRGVFVTLRDVSGNTMSAPATDSIILDQAGPTGGTLRVVPGNASATITWTSAADAPAGIAGYRLAFAENAAPATCADGTVLRNEAQLTLTAVSFVHTGLVNGTTYGWRLCGVDKAGNVGVGLTVTGQPRLEFAPPTATVVINDGAAFTKTPDVTLKITGTDASGVASFCASNVTGVCSSFTAFTASPMTLPFTLTNTAGARSVFVTLKDTLGNITAAPATDAITLDTTVPTGGVLTVTPLVASLKLTWTASTDAGGVESYRIFAGATTPADCSGTPVGTATTTTFTHLSLVNNQAVAYRVCPVDRAGNVGVGFVGVGTPRAELVGPVGTVVINGGVAFTNNASLSVAVSATDATGVAGLCIATTATGCTTVFDAYDGSPTTKVVPVTAVAGVKTLFVALEDTLGNISTTSKAVTMDLTAPTGGALTFTTTQAAALQLTWTTSTDTGGVAGYRVFASGTATPPTGCTGTPTATTDAATRSFLHTGLSTGTALAYRICPIDVAGNVGVGFTGIGTARVEIDPPTNGVVVINGGAIATNNNLVSLTITATDASGLGDICVSNANTACTVFTAVTDSPVTVPSFTMTNTVGARTVFVTLRDKLGNTSTTPVSDGIVLDKTAPTALSLTASPGTNEVGLNWSATDPVGIKNFRLVVLTGALAPLVKCTTGTQLASGPGTSLMHTGLAAGQFTYRLCAEDNAGNVADGVTKTVTVTVPGSPSVGCGRTLLSTDFRDTTRDGNPEAETTLVVGGITRRAAIRIPSGYDPTFPHAIVYEFHGDQNAGFTPNPLTFTRGLFGADEYGGQAIVIALRGENLLPANVRDDFASFVSWDTQTPPPANLDIAAIRAFRTYVEEKACVETGKVFAVGFSGGGFLAQLMRCFGEDFTAIANFESGLDLPAYDFLFDDAGLPLHIDTTRCVSTPVPQLVVHFANDGAVDQQQGIDTADFWAAQHGCSGQVNATQSALDPECVEYSGCGVGEDVVLCTPAGGDHSVWSPQGTSVLLSFFDRFF